MIIKHQGEDFDTDKIKRVKHIYGYGSDRAVRIYSAVANSYFEHGDPDGSLYEAFQKNGVYAS